MPNRIFKEPFSGKYNAVVPASVLPQGWISDGLNVRKISGMGGWKARMGTELHHTTQIAALPVLSIHQFEKEEQLIVQCNSLLYESTAQPPLSHPGAFGSSLLVAVSATVPGFSDEVENYWFYADGSGMPLMYGRNATKPRAFFAYDVSEFKFVDNTQLVQVLDTANPPGLILEAAGDKAIVISRTRIGSMTITLGSGVNSNAVTMTLRAWRSGGFTAVASLVDGTETGGTTTLAQSGTVTWGVDSADTMALISGVQGFAYEIGWSGALSGSVDVTKITLVEGLETVENKWDGIWELVDGCRFYDESLDQNTDELGLVSVETISSAMDLASSTTLDRLYIGTVEPATAFGLGVPIGNENTASGANISLIEYWDGDSWASAGAPASDTTLDIDLTASPVVPGGISLSQTGVITFDASAITPYRRSIQGDPVPKYWYRLSWDAALSADTQVYLITYAPYPERLGTYDGCVEYKGRLFLWGDKHYPNRLRYSAFLNPDALSGSDAGFTKVFGDQTPINRAVRYYDKLLVFKRRGVFTLEEVSPGNFLATKIADRIGLVSPQSVQVAELGSPSMNRDEVEMVAVWQDTDGVYLLDSSKPKKVSLPVDNYFNREYGLPRLDAEQMYNTGSYFDHDNNEYHLLAPDSAAPFSGTGYELVYNVVTDEWYPQWDREVRLVSGRVYRTSDTFDYIMGGSKNGFVFQTETGTQDDNVSNVLQSYATYVTTRGIGIGEQARIALRFTLRRITAIIEAQSAGSMTISTARDLADAFTSQGTSLLTNSGFQLAANPLAMSLEECDVVQVKFSLTHASSQLKLWEFIYELEGRGLIEAN